MIEVCGREIRIQGRFLRIARLEGEGYEFIEAPDDLLKELRRSGRPSDLFTFLQRPADPSPKFDYPMEWDNFAALPVSTFEHWWARQVDHQVRKKVRNAERKGVTVQEVAFGADLVHGISEIYNECPIRQGRRFRHHGKDFKTIYAEEATFLERSVFVGAYLNGGLIGFAKLVSDETGTQAGLMNILSMNAHRDKAPTNALIAHAVRLCAERGIRYLLYGHFAYGKKERSSLSDFKEYNGFRRIDVPRYFVPLTLRGAAALRLGLHRRWTDRLPEPLLARLRELRRAWYGRKIQAVKESA